jgi:hypothetical protein
MVAILSVLHPCHGREAANVQGKEKGRQRDGRGTSLPPFVLSCVPAG